MAKNTKTVNPENLKIIKHDIDLLLKNPTFDALEVTCHLKRIENLAKKEREPLVGAANVVFFNQYGGKAAIIDDCIVKPYNKPKSYIFSDTVVKLEERLKALKKSEIEDGTAILKEETEVSAIFSVGTP